MSHCVLLTGATGFLGSHMLKALLEQEHTVLVLHRPGSDLSRLEPYHDRVTPLELGDLPQLSQALRDNAVDTIVHLACQQGRDGATIVELVEANVLLGLRLLEAAVAAGVPQFLNADTQLDASVNAYAQSKKQFAQWLPAYASSVAIANLRLGNIYGPGEPDGGFLGWLLSQLASNEATIDFTPGEQLRDFVHAADVCTATLAVQRQMTGPGLATYDVGSGQMHSLREFVESAQRVFRQVAGEQCSTLNFGGLPYREGEVMRPTFDTTGLLATGWQPHYTLESGLRDTIAAFLAANSGGE